MLAPPIQRPAARPRPERLEAGARGSAQRPASVDSVQLSQVIQRASSDRKQPRPGRVSPASVTTALESGGGRPLEAETRTRMQRSLGADLGRVRLHTGPASARAAEDIHARAFTRGQDVHFGVGQYRPGTGEGDRLLAHELVHTVQQARGLTSVRRSPVISEPGDPLEQEAEAIAARVAGGRASSPKVPRLSTMDDRIQRNGGSGLTNLQQLDEMLDRFDVPEGEVIDLLGRLSAPEKATVLAGGYRGRMASALNVGEMVRAVSQLNPPLPTKLDWVDAAATLTSQIDYRDIQALVVGAPQGERDALKTAHWQQFFLSVCTNVTMPQALRDLRFDLGTTLDWMQAEVFSVRLELSYADIKGFVTTAPQAERDVLKTAAWRDFFIAICTNVTMEEAVTDLAFDLATQVAWMMAESDAATVLDTATFMASVRAAPDYVALMNLLGVSDVLSYDLRRRLSTGDKPGFFAELNRAAGARAGDVTVRRLLTDAVAARSLTWAEAFTAAVLLELGPRRDWPPLIQNYDDGLTAGAFALTALPPAGAEPLRQFCLRQAGEAAEGTGVMASYRNQFNVLWDAPPHAALPADFDPTLDSKGPRNRRARSIFAALYADATVKSAYDNDAPAGFREMCDTLMGPEGLNLLASPRLQTLLAFFRPPAAVVTGLGDPVYVNLTNGIRLAAMMLDAADRLALQRSPSWRLLTDAKVSGPTPADTQILREDLWTIVTTSRPAAPTAPAAPATPAPVEAPPALNAAKRAWLAGIRLAAPPSPVQAQTATQDLTFQVTSSGPNPGVPARRHLVLEPGSHVISGEDDQTPWPVGSASVPHTATVDPEAGASPSRVFTARVNMPPVPAAEFAERTATVTVEDKRRDWFRTHIALGATYMDENVQTALAAGSTVHFYGGQLSVTVRPGLPAANPGLLMEMDGELKRGGASVHTYPRRPFERAAQSNQLGEYVLQEGSAPPPVELVEIQVSFYPSGGPAFQTLNLAFHVAPGLPVAAGTDAAVLAADNATLVLPAATPGSLLHYMTTNFPAASPENRVANAVATGAIQVEAVIVRSDSAAWLAAHAGNPMTQVAYACGNMTDARVLAAGPGAIGWRRSIFPNHVFLNLTPRINAPGTKRPNAEMADLLAHEGIHAADRIQPNPLGRYSTEFRAYWVMGVGSGRSTAPDPTMTGLGPKSPRARQIFEHLYNHPLYSTFTQPNYDANIDHFRERVDNMLVPDGINLALSGQLQALRAEIESHPGPAAFATTRARVLTRYAACTPDDQAEISGNRAWRDLVEAQFTPAADRATIKNDLAIPQ